MNKIIIYSTMSCPYCVRAKELLTSLKLDYEEIDLGADPEKFEELSQKTSWQTVPQIFINNEFVGGFDDLNKLVNEGTLRKLKVRS